MLAVLYDIHGNLPALEAVLADADAAGADRYLLGGDYDTPSPWPNETISRLRELPSANWIRGNGERWLRERPRDRPEVLEVYERFSGQAPEQLEEWLYALPERAELDGVPVIIVTGDPVNAYAHVGDIENEYQVLPKALMPQLFDSAVGGFV